MCDMGNARDEGDRILVVDVGNSAIDLGLAREGVLEAVWKITTPVRMTADEACSAVASLCTWAQAGGPGRAPALDDVSDGVVASVVPHLTDAWVEALSRIAGRRPLVVGPGVKTGMKMRYNDPGELGADRVADLVAAKEVCTPPFVVVDLGTTTNFEVVDAQGVFLGGIIAPGLRLSARALSDAAAQLADVDVHAPSSVIGKNTREAMRAGIVAGEVARIDGLVDAVWRELGCTTEVVATGEDAAAIAALSSRIERVEPRLTLRGLALLHGLNRKR